MAFTPAERFVNLGMSFPLAKEVGDAIEDIVPDNVVLLTTDQTVAGVKTFSSSPVVPTATLADSSTKAASTAFVLTNAGKSKTQIAALTAIADPSTATAEDCADAINAIIAALKA